ncbi:hypothetical protein QBC46DRAFT_353680 [Diplogelasinospora grovesii]|uniref:Uncharacterized protein n=1 Tax=Diplogelasinospora grovesii TaxID=303347 RepID=A0AAN6N843_9PEZI|nr:hypothetical protein QBC46DRAFT_353680 [Diplogelasinospora grovesii]
MSTTKQKTTRVQSLGALLPKAGVQYDPNYLPFTASQYSGYVVFAMKEAKLCKTFIMPTFVDELIGDMFQEMYRSAHTIKGLGIDTFWKLVCSNVGWVRQSPLINVEIIAELSSHMMEARLRFKNSGTKVDPRYLGKAATMVDKYLGRLAELDLHAHIPNIFEDAEGDFDEFEEDEFDEEDLLRWQNTSHADLAVNFEYAGQYDKFFGNGPYVPKWDENIDLVTLPTGYVAPAIAPAPATSVLKRKTYDETMDIDEDEDKPNADIIRHVKKQQAGNGASMPTASVMECMDSLASMMEATGLESSAQSGSIEHLVSINRKILPAKKPKRTGA